MTVFTATLTRWRIEWLVLLWRPKLRRETVRLEKLNKRFELHNARITELLTPQQFLEYAANLRDSRQIRVEQQQTLELFVHLLRTQHHTGDLVQVEALLRKLVST